MNHLIERVTTHPFFRGMKPPHLAILAECAAVASFKPDEILFREGDPANEFYIIESGRIALEAHELADGTALVQRLGAGEVLGWSWLFSPFIYQFQARAIEPTEVIVLNGGHLLVATESDHEFGYELMKRMSEVVIKRLQATRKMLLEASAKAVSN